ncbi:hypothetical protein D1AOALGA4SA_82 [Olavius algarvensis Delta 1 endosymbiont]|nr:hypothetical protein D1AOALGA4SA_82 [Olavius algarvensis Delta 1 endosymbiont]
MPAKTKKQIDRKISLAVGHRVENGRQALEVLQNKDFDLAQRPEQR